MKNTIEIIEVEISKLKEWKKNPKLHNLKLLEKSIKEFGYINMIIVDEKFNILSGHGRLEILKKLKINKVKVVQCKGLSSQQKEKFRLLDNKTSEGGWDFDLLKNFEFELLEEVGFSRDEIDIMRYSTNINIIEQTDRLSPSKRFIKSKYHVYISFGSQYSASVERKIYEQLCEIISTFSGKDDETKFKNFLEWVVQIWQKMKN